MHWKYLDLPYRLVREHYSLYFPEPPPTNTYQQLTSAGVKSVYLQESCQYNDLSGSMIHMHDNDYMCDMPRGLI